ncbi:hypothetical protein F5148DRAFT_1281376 [Russula earlei]|uniref:Uncharacterized protein n=1 Tax=Russula earlei TaxID=71964 RepID=A0ACC0UHW5_9AGAM|nr:hypothetical protein F5148DRAFT_1281376 [Russula earlei]
MSLAVPQSEVDQIVRGLHIAVIARYLGAAGLVALLYDHALTLSDEIRLIWTAPRSFAKWMFLVNRYLSEVCLVAVANEMFGFNHRPYTEKTYDFNLIRVVCVYGVFATFTNNLVAFLRVVVLWDKSPRISLVLSIIMILSFLATITCTTISIIFLSPFIRYSDLARTCYFTKTGPSYIALWAAPMGFELSVIFLVAYDALSRPRIVDRPLVRTLYRDGMLFFLAVWLLRMTNLAFAVVTEPGLIALPIFFSWGMVSLAINRMLIHIRSSEERSQRDDNEDNDDDDDAVASSVNFWGQVESAHGGSIGTQTPIELRTHWTK